MNELLQVIRALLRDEPLPENLENFSFDKLVYQAARHNLTAMLYTAVKDDERIPAPIKSSLKKQFMSLVNQRIEQEYYTQKLDVFLHANGIRYAFFKGETLREVYPDPYWRSSCDVDVLFDKAYEKEIQAWLNGEGFVKTEDGNKTAAYCRGSVNVETHRRLFAERSRYAVYYEDAFARMSSEDGVKYAFSQEDFYVYFLAHAAEHFRAGGLGLRTVLDCYLYRKAKLLEEEYLHSELEKLQLLVFAQQLEALAECCFGDGEWTEEKKFLFEYALDAGSYGNRDTATAMKTVGHDGKVKGKTRYFFAKLFPSFAYMKTYYPWVKRCPILYPFSWLVRLCAVVFCRRERVKETLRTTRTVSKEKTDTAQRALQMMGL